MTKPEDSVSQNADQTAQQAAQAIGETIRSVIDQSRTGASQEIGAEREFETGTDEFFKAASQLNFLNAKRTYDEYQQESLESVRENRTIVNRMGTLAVDHDQQVRNISIQVLQNAVETANMVGKQAVRHSDIAIDREWNVDEQGYTVADILRDQTFKDAIAAAVAMAVNVSE